MTGRIKLAELKQREGLQGEVFKLFPSWHTGIIRGDDGNDVTFCEDSLVVGFSYGELSVGLRVSYSLLFAAVSIPVENSPLYRSEIPHP